MRSLIRAVRSVGLRALSPSTYSEKADRILAEDRNADLIVRAATSPTTLAGTPGLQAIAVAFAAALVPVSAAAALISRSLRLEWGRAAQVRVPGLSLPDAVWLAEGVAIPIVQGVSSIDAVLDPYKLGTAVTLTSEVMLSSNADALINAALLAKVGPSLDAALFSTAAGVPGISPPGLLHNVTPITATAGGGSAAMIADMQALAVALGPVAGNNGIVLIASIKQSVALAMAYGSPPYAVLTSSALASGTVVAVATQALCSIVSVPRIEASDQWAAQLQTTPSGDLLTGSPVRSAFQTDSVGIRFILPASWALRGPGIAVINNTTW